MAAPRHRSQRACGVPTLVRPGDFRKQTGLLQRSSNDRLILSKN
ncbi:keywimysin-related RiPP [Streptomyces sp. ASQP_92]|nr:keywimysin-related RiPP [Streptomyces sp. ASQP_92]MCT9094017.1 keywimysin-related RiPP [Streptomyces sp. ASQP_92]